jgi:general secretion pathway protein J
MKRRRSKVIPTLRWMERGFTPLLRSSMDRRNRASGRFKKGWFTSGIDIFATTGFTLIEVMVALTILGFILLMVFGAFRLGLSAWEKGESAKEEYQNVRIISQLISRQMKSIVPYKIKTQKAEGDYLAFEGKLHVLKFVSAIPIKARQSEGFVYVIYELKEGGREGSRLVLYEQRALNRDFLEEEPKQELGVALLEGISDVRFEYYREEDPEKNRTTEWVEEWNVKEEKELPKAIRMTITYKDGKGKKEEFPFVVMASLPAHRYEEVRTGPRRMVIPQRPPGTGS